MRFLCWRDIGLVLLAFAAVAHAADRPNVVVVMTDDQGYGDFGCHGNSIVQTPHLDRFHGESVRLTDFHVDPSCAPTRAALLTGRYAARAGVWDTSSGRQILRRDETTAADVFRKNGYRTAIFGKWHLGQNYPYLPANRGFDESLVHYAGGIGQLGDFEGNDYYDDTYFRDGKPEKVQGYCGDVWFREGIRFIEENRDRPFFLYLPSNTPHGPYLVPEKYSKPYLEKGVPDERARFYGMCTNIDDNFALLRRRLGELGLEENTILVFLTDNGGTGGLQLSAKYHGFVTSGYNAGMRGAKQSMYEGGHRVPCFIRWPAGRIGGSPGRDIPQLTAHFDLLPTLVDLCGLRGVEEIRFDGRSLAPLVRGTRAAWPQRKLVVAVNRNQDPPRWYRTAILSERWRLINGGVLYDMEADPGQRHDVAAQHPEVVAELRAFYETYWDDLAPRFRGFSRLLIGAPEANPTTLTAHDILETDRTLAVEVARSGRYEITLMDRPHEEKGPLGIAEARIVLGDVDIRKAVDPEATTAVFTTRLEAGDAFLKTWLTHGRTGESRDAKYMVFRYVDGP